jgi:hypothetical protein
MYGTLGFCFSSLINSRLTVKNGGWKYSPALL